MVEHPSFPEIAEGGLLTILPPPVIKTLRRSWVSF
jgi:hypothetical protein